MKRALARVTVALAVLAANAAAVAPARAQEPKWRFEPVRPPQLPSESDQEHRARLPIALGKIGDIKFFAPNRGLLITAGNPPTIPPGVWAYNGQEWHQLTGEGPSHEGVCGATDGRIAWAGPDEFWTVSDGRRGQAKGEKVPLEDNTLCHFAGGEIVGSYATLAFRPDSYQPMHAAACIDPGDCWFAGENLPKSEESGAGSQVGSFHLHWNGSAVSAQPNHQGHAVEDMRAFGRNLLESVQIKTGDEVTEPESPSSPSLLHLITPIGEQPTFLSLHPGVPLYGEGEKPTALGFLHLGSDEHALWGAADPASAGSLEGAEVTVIRDQLGPAGEQLWSQLLGPSTDPVGGNPFTKFREPKTSAEENANEQITSLAADPGSESAWLALTSPANAGQGAAALAMLARIASDGTVSDRQTLPSPEELAQGIGPRGAAEQLTCPAPGDCWLTTTRGWLFHLSDGNPLPLDTDPVFSKLITFRPADAGIPAVIPDAPPPDDSGLLGERPSTSGSLLEAPAVQNELRVSLPLVSHLRSRLVHGTTLQLSFQLAALARVRLLAERGRRIVASTPSRTLAAGRHTLSLRLDRRLWPKKIDLQTRALAALPTVSTRNPNTTTVSTELHVLPGSPSFTGAGSLP